MMKEIIKKLEKRFEELSEKYVNVLKAMDSISLVDFDDHEQKRRIIEDLRQKHQNFGEEKQNLLNAIRALRKVCTHTNPDGSNAYCKTNNNYAKCEICGKEIKI